MIVAMIFLLSSFLGCVQGQTKLTPEEFYVGIQNGTFNVVVDVRTVEEWDAGHIENATFVENLASSGTPDLILGCKQCTMVIYCRVGNRAGNAIIRLREEFGFEGKLYNGLGVNQWTDEGYPLVTEQDSVNPPCRDGETCVAGEDNAPCGEEVVDCPFRLASESSAAFLKTCGASMIMSMLSAVMGAILF